MADHRGALRRFGPIGPGLALAVVLGLVGACGGGEGEALTTRTGVTATRPAATVTPTRTRPTVPTPTATAPGTTEASPVEPTPTEPATTAAPPTTTATFTLTETETETETERETETETTVVVPTVPDTTTAEPAPTTTAAAAETTTESTNDTPWGWIALGAALAAALLIGVVLWRRRRAGAAGWSNDREDLSRRVLVALDAVLSDGSLVTGQIQALAAEARSLEARAPDDPSGAAAGRLRASLDELAGTLQADRALRLGSPPPSEEQLSYSTALIRQQAEQLQGVLRPPPAGPPEAWS